MNFLAHAYLSYGNEELLIGNFIGDEVKGSQYLNYLPGIQKGILLHRQIDFFTDTHPLLLELKNLLRKSNGRYAPIALDILLDHILAKTWSDYHLLPLEVFVKKTLDTLSLYQKYLPQNSNLFLNFAIKTNRIIEYASLQGIYATLEQFGKRIQAFPPLENAISIFQQNESQFFDNFKTFFAEITAFVKQWIQDHFYHQATEIYFKKP